MDGRKEGKDGGWEDEVGSPTATLAGARVASGSRRRRDRRGLGGGRSGAHSGGDRGPELRQRAGSSGMGGMDMEKATSLSPTEKSPWILRIASAISSMASREGRSAMFALEAT